MGPFLSPAEPALYRKRGRKEAGRSMRQDGQFHELHPLPIPQAPYLDGPILLKDGHPAYLRQARPEDRDQVEALIDRCSAVSQALHFLKDTSRDSAAIAEQL